MQNTSFRKNKRNEGSDSKRSGSNRQNSGRPNSGRSNSGRPNGGSNRGNGGGRKKSTLDPNLLVKKATKVEQEQYVSNRTFEQMPISMNLKECLIKKGFKSPTEIQDKTLESLLDGKDLLGIAQTGTGKTGAFLIPIIDKLLNNKRNPYALVVVPTRELAVQVEDEFKSMSNGLGIYSACFIGGTNINRDAQVLRRSSHIIIGTPGRLIDLVNRRLLDLRKFNTLVLDEFDRMLDMGFVHDVKKIIGMMEQRKHTMLFSATLDKTQNTLINEILTDPVRIKVSQGDSTGDQIDQDIVRMKPGEKKFDKLLEMLYDQDFEKVLLFEETKHKAKRLCEQLNKADILSDQIHGNKSQAARQRALNLFKEGKIRVLVATDVAARGIDVSDVTHVINYQVPQTFDSYIHRIGRTGRAGKTGKAFTFVE